jgi:serine/threonine-protein kinase RsbW
MACALPLETASLGSYTAAIFIASTPLAVRDGLRAVLMLPAMSRLSNDARGRVELVLAEALNNIVEHAYDRENGQIELRCHGAQTHLFCEIIDSGAQMPDEQLPAGLSQPLDENEDLPEGGFGWFLIRSLTEDLVYRRVNARNHLTFKLNIEQ